MTQPDFGKVARSGKGKPSPILFIVIGGVLLLCLCFVISTFLLPGGDDRDAVLDPGNNLEQVDGGGEQGGDDLDSLLDDFPADEPTAEFQESAPDVAVDGDGVLILANNGDVEVCYVFISPSGGDSWGDDRLPEGDDGVVLVGEEMVFSVNAGIYDVQARDCDDNVLDEIYEAELPVDEEIMWEIQ